MTKFNLFLKLIFIVFIFFIILGGPCEIIFIFWYSLGFSLLLKIYSHISYILLILELLTLVMLRLLIFSILKLGIELRFLFLCLCLVVGEASLGLRLMIIRSRFQRKELLSLNLN